MAQAAAAMYPVPAQAQRIVQEWSKELTIKFGEPPNAMWDGRLSVGAFPIQTLRIELMDESVVEFRYAFYIVSEPKRAVAVFTEHCGYHVFPYHDAKIYCDGALVYKQE